MIVYRMCDDPDRDGIVLFSSYLPIVDLQRSLVAGVHRGKIILYKSLREGDQLQQPEVLKLGVNILMFKIVDRFQEHLDDFAFTNQIYATESSPLIYIVRNCVEEHRLFTFDTEKMQFHQTLRLRGLMLAHSTFYGTVTSTQLPLTHFAKDVSSGYSSKFFKEFEVNKILGIGGFRCVFEAVNKSDNCKYAVKRVAVGKK
ncbi:hypothetical protein PENTCL1PPCAC_8476 [Pristionchus entomophagus]|uniref:Protein kinase n=1 Tax=Pristionchus entomophagus TaxID=358040 RepID=A0AAV5T3L4_9BILA|nr:hypothetical protein PENTCL1PPCAC_8476 [Pristionchus entomophagus]